jgi:long-chain acyl-CoA synthetase
VREVSTGTELFERGIRERPDEPALLYFETAISFRAAGELARALAAGLRDELGLVPGERVALMLQNMPQTAIAIHAAWLCGAIVTTINPMAKEREVRHQLADSGARVVICLESLHEVLAAAREGTAVEHLVTTSELEMLDEVPQALADHERLECPGAIAFADLCAGAPEFEAIEVHPDSPAFLAYTSGTTGVPKGAIVTHRAAIHNAEAMREWWSLGPGDVTVAMAPLFHITGLICHLATARASATPLLLLFRFEPGEFLRLVERWQGSFVIGPLTAFIAMLEHPSFDGRDLSSLSKVASGGAPVYPAVVEEWERRTGAYVHNSYGLTESSAPSHLVPAGRRAPIDPASGALSIGVPIPNTESRVVSIEDGGELGPGEVGQIVTRGAGVFPGYWNRPEESAVALLDGWLQTGDVGMRDADGWFYLVDRIKDMIVVSGYKVWPRDVEDVLYRHPAVLEAAVVGVPDDYRGETVVAHVVLRAGAEVGAAELIAHCREAMAVYKTPRAVRFVAELPKTTSGKTLRRELRERGAIS